MSSLLDGYGENLDNNKSSLLDGYNEPQQSNIKPLPINAENAIIPITSKRTLPDKTKIKYLPTGEIDTEHFKNNIDAIYDIPQVERPKSNVLMNSDGEIKIDRKFEDRFIDRDKNFISNAGKDIKDSVTGLAQLAGNVYNFTVARPLMNAVLGDKNLPLKDRIFTGEGLQDLNNLQKALPHLKEGLKENYGQKDIDIINFERIKNGESPIKFDIEGLAQSFYAHPLNLLDVVGAGEIGKIGQLKTLTKGGELSNFSKQVGNKVVKPTYSENLVYNAGQRLLETKPVQQIIKNIDNSPFREGTDVIADFLGLAPESRLLGTKGAEVRNAKLIEQRNQTKNITQRNDAIAQNQQSFSGLSDTEAKDLIKSIESGTSLTSPTSRMIDVKNALKAKVEKNAEYYMNNGLLSPQTVHDVPINTYASIKYNKPIDKLTDPEKLDALKDIENMPAEQRPFYIPMMYDDKLKAGDFFASSTKRFKPNELKQRTSGMGLEVNQTGGKRIYDPIELANRLDAHRIKMVNTENMINELIDNFAKPFDMSKDRLLEGYVPFNPDAFMKFYKKSIDLNETTLRKLDELQNVDTVLKSSIEEAIRTLPNDIIELLGAAKNNKIYQIPESVADALMKGKNKKGIWEMMFDMGTAGFKRKVLGLSPKWFINNRIGNGIMAALKGVNINDYLNTLKTSDDLLPEALRAKSMYEAEKTIIGRAGGGNNDFFGNTMRLLSGEFIDTSSLKSIEKAKIQLANTLGVPGKVINAITDAMFNFNQRFENFERKAAYLHSVDNIGRKMIKTTGQNIVKQEELLKAVLNDENILNTVLKEVDNTLGDYINMTSQERRFIRKLVPFYSWYRTITRYTLSLAETNPIRVNLTNKLAMAISEENDDLPEYQRGAIETNLTAARTNKPLVLNYEHSIPFSTFGDTADNPMGLINPLIVKLTEAARGKREFMNKPFVSPNYENVFPNGYASLNKNNLGEFTQELPLPERLKSIPVGLARTIIPTLEWIERVGIGGLDNLARKGIFTPKDALFDTSFGGYNYDEGFYKNPKGWTNEEQLLRYFLPIQQKGNIKEKVKTKRNPL